jgi:translocation and assembly module TamA
MTRGRTTISRVQRAVATLGVAASVGILLPTSGQALDQITFSVSGENEVLRERITAASLLTAAEAEGRVAAEDLLATARAEYRALTGVLYGAGYYGGSISVRIDGREAADLSPLNPPVRIGTISVQVDPGPAFVFGKAKVAPVAPETEIPEAFATGAPAASGVIGDAARAAVSGWRDQGHPKAALGGQSVTADHAARTLSADIEIDPGPKLAFGAFSIKGNERVRSERVAEIAGYPQGETFDPDALDKAAKRLRRTGAFRSVGFTEAETPDGDTLPMALTVVEENRRRLGFGVELAAQEGVTLSGFWLHRNLFRGAERLRVDFELGQIGGESTNGDPTADVSLSFRYQRPATFTPDTDAFLEGEIARVDDPEFLSRSLTLGAGVEHIFSDVLTGEIGLSYRASRVTDTAGTRDFEILALPITVTRDTRDVALNATQGTYLRALVSPFVGVSGTENGALLKFDARAYRGFGAEANTVLAGRFQLGALSGPSIADAPPDFLFFAGGGGSVRGQPFQAIGVTDAAGNTTGGRSFIGVQAEVRTKVTDAIGLVGFLDAGYIGAESFYDGSGNWISGAGVGVRYDTPIGPIRVDVGTPLDGGPADASAVQIYIGIGQAF